MQASVHADPQALLPRGIRNDCVIVTCRQIHDALLVFSVLFSFSNFASQVVRSSLPFAIMSPEPRAARARQRPIHSSITPSKFHSSPLPLSCTAS